MKDYLVIVSGQCSGECFSGAISVEDDATGGRIYDAAYQLIVDNYGDMSRCYFISRIERIE